jgi:hypothetical protein
MRDAKFFLVVRFSVEPQAEAQLMLYGIESRAPFEKHMRIERFCGEVETSHAA